MEVYNDIIFDSREEVWCAMWLEALKNSGHIKEWSRANSIEIFRPFKATIFKRTELKTKIKTEEKDFTFLNGLVYTPDFIVTWTRQGKEKFLSHIGYDMNPKSWFFYNTGNGEFPITWIEVKPTFDQNGKTAKFSVIQKILWNVHKIFVDLIIPEKLFEGTFMPQEAMPEFKYKKKPTGKNKGVKGPGDWKTNYIPKSLNEFLNEKT